MSGRRSANPSHFPHTFLSLLNGVLLLLSGAIRRAIFPSFRSFGLKWIIIFLLLEKNLTQSGLHSFFPYTG